LYVTFNMTHPPLRLTSLDQDLRRRAFVHVFLLGAPALPPMMMNRRCLPSFSFPLNPPAGLPDPGRPAAFTPVSPTHFFAGETQSVPTVVDSHFPIWLSLSSVSSQPEVTPFCNARLGLEACQFQPPGDLSSVCTVTTAFYDRFLTPRCLYTTFPLIQGEP